MSNIIINNLTFAYEGSYSSVFENVSLRISSDWNLGLIGRNGRGKTTLLELLMGKHEYYGSIISDVVFNSFPIMIGDPNSPVINILQTIAPECMDWQFVKELSLLGETDELLYSRYSTLSSGQQTKVLLAGMFACENGFPLLDEPTNHLDLGARNILAEYLKTKKGFILVSHDRTLLDSCTDHIISINKNGIDIQKGNYSTWWRNKKMRDDFELAQNETLKKDISRLSESAARSSQWADKIEKSKFGTKNSGLKVDRGYIGHKSAKMMKHAKSVERRTNELAGEKSALLHDVETDLPLIMTPLLFHTNRLVEIKNLALDYAGKCIFENLTFDIIHGERLSVCGKNGCGKTSLLKTICGDLQNFSGKVIINNQLKISYVPQQTNFLLGSLSDYANKLEIEDSLLKSTLQKLGLGKEEWDKEIQYYSEGQKKKVLLAGSICQKAHLFIWDEPLNFIDVVSRNQIEEMLLKYSPTLLFVEHDTTFNKNIATRTIEL